MLCIVSGSLACSSCSSYLLDQGALGERWRYVQLHMCCLILHADVPGQCICYLPEIEALCMKQNGNPNGIRYV